MSARIKWILLNPTLCILAILSVALLSFGIYLGSPWYISAPGSTIDSTFSSKQSQIILASIYCTPPLVTLGGLWLQNKAIIIRGAGWLFAIYLFATLLRINSIGWLPAVWIFILACGLIAGVCKLSLEVKTDGDK